MKGKGKGKDQIDLKECPLRFLDFTPIDHTQTCSKYTSILQKTDEDCISSEDLQNLQFELESLLVSVVKRKEELDQEIEILSSWQDKKDKKPSGKLEPEAASGKRSRISEEKPAKKAKDNSGKAHVVPPVSVPVPVTRPKHKTAQPAIEAPIEVPKPKNESPNRFWNSLEPYCADLTQEHVKFLEEWMTLLPEEEEEYYEIPSLGNHYSHVWSHKDVQDEQREGAKPNGKLKNPVNNTPFSSSDAEKLLKEMEKKYDSDDNSTAFGPLTHCLVNCLIEEKLMSSLEDNIQTNNDTNDRKERTKMTCIKSIDVVNCLELEKRIYKELGGMGIFEMEDSGSESGDDEVYADLKRTQNTLKSLVEHNIRQKKKMKKLVLEEIARQDLRKRLQVIDNEVMDFQRKVVLLRQKKKSITKKEREQLTKILKERSSLVTQLKSAGYSLL